jgi:uncharacterized hydrophobic protein (TIGR00271 family)
MVHLRIVAPPGSARHALDLLNEADSVCNVVHLPGAATKPSGDVILCDVTREDTSVILSDLRELDIPAQGSITLESIESQISDAAERAERASYGAPADAVIWEEVEARTSEETKLSVTFVAFMVIAMLIAMAGILLDTTILIIGAMIVGPEFGPLAGICVAIVQRRGPLAKRSVEALAVGFPVGIAITFVVTLVLKWTNLVPDGFHPGTGQFTAFITHPDFFTVLVAVLAGAAGVLSLTSAKSGALIGVLISVTTIPAASNIGVAAAYADWSDCAGAAAQLAVNLSCIVLAGVGTLFLQSRLYRRRRKRHMVDPARAAAGLPIGRSKRGTLVLDTKEIEGLQRRRESDPG